MRVPSSAAVVVASILGWAKRYGYGHIGQLAQREAVELLDAKPKRKKKGSRGSLTRGGHKKAHLRKVREAESLNDASRE
jgi:hypothetical protein